MGQKKQTMAFFSIHEPFLYPVDKKVRMRKSVTTGIAPIPTYSRDSYTGRTVYMVRKEGKWIPTNGRYVERLLDGKLKINVLCHDEDKDPPKNYKL